MFGISASGKEAIGKIVEDIFDRIALQFIGNIPRLKDAKRLVISSQQNFGLPHLFVQAMTNRSPNYIEQDVLKSLLESSNGYIESLKNKTKSNVSESLDGIVRQARIQNRSVSDEEVQSVIDEELKRAGTHLQVIVESESTKFRNLGTMMDISQMASSIGDVDPTVFFIIIKDSTTCTECIRLHTTDGVTPRLWKFSELKQGYHKRGEDNASSFGLHPHCRCTMTYLSRGFGFDNNGKLKYISEDHDLYEQQRST